MENYVEKAPDLNIRGNLFHVKAVADGYVYTDAECTIKATKAVLTHAFEMNNAVIIDGDIQYRPIFMTKVAAEAHISLTYIKAVTTTATLTVVHSSEYVAG